MPATILLVEDDAPIAEVMQVVLEEEGHRVILARDGVAALEQIQQDGFDLMVTDNMLPQIQGVELIDYMHDHPALATPVILTSAAKPLPTPPRTIFLPKPFDIDEVVALVRSLLPGN